MIGIGMIWYTYNGLKMDKCHYCEFDFSDWFLLTFKLKDRNIEVCEDCYFENESELCDNQVEVD